MPFRQAHSVVGGLVRDSLERHVPLAELVEAHPALGSEAVALLEPGVAVTRRTTPGSAGPGRWPTRSVASPTASRPTGSGWPGCPEPGAGARVTRGRPGGLQGVDHPDGRTTVGRGSGAGPRSRSSVLRGRLAR